jgi:TRAP-type C4-dicarboxylate transport system substrate-binding protein
MIRKIKINTLQAAVVSGEGLNGISSFSNVLSLPLLLRSEDEFDYVFEKIREDFEKDIEKSGFTMVGWTRAGWMYFYARNPVVTPDDMRSLKLASADTDVIVAPMLKTLGFNTVSLTLNEIMSGLVSGMVDACYTVPLGAVAYQWFGIARHMTDLPLAPAIGGILVSNRTWNRIPDDIKPDLMETVDRAVERLLELSQETEAEVMDIMKENGLVVHDVPASVQERWKELFSEGIEAVVGKAFSRDIYETVVRHLEAYRTGR